MPLRWHLWLLCPPYCRQVFPEGSNLRGFAEMFRTLYVDQVSDTFSDCWRVFGKLHEGHTQGFPADTRLRRNFLAYMETGGIFGSGYGLLLHK